MSVMVLAAALAGAIGGCDAPPETIAGSDVPQIVGLENRHLSGLEHDGETLVGARALYRGAMVDPSPMAQQTTARFLARGWTLERKRISTTSATLLFAKGDREVEVDLKASQLNPAMGVGAIDVRRHGAPGGTAGAADASGAAGSESTSGGTS